MWLVFGFIFTFLLGRRPGFFALGSCGKPQRGRKATAPLHTPRAFFLGVLGCGGREGVDFCLYASVLDVERCADLVPGFFGTYGGMLCRSAIWFWDSSVLMVVRCADLVPVFFGTYGGTLCRSSSWILRYL